MEQVLPTLFVSHGAPTLFLEPQPTRDFLLELGASLPRPRAILCLSAHWTTRKPMVSLAPSPSTIHDFYGFPDELYEVSYPAPGSPELARRVLELLDVAGIDAGGDAGRGLDHGAWVPIGLMYPEADIPVVQLSVQPDMPATFHCEVGRALAPLRREGVLVMGSGSATHNLADIRWGRAELKPPHYVLAFDSWLKQAVLEGRGEDLAGYLELGPEARRNHPTPEHYLPLLSPMTMGAMDGKASLIHGGYTFGVLSMAAFRWDN